MRISYETKIWCILEVATVNIKLNTPQYTVDGSICVLKIDTNFQEVQNN